MTKAKGFREQARGALAGNWASAVGTTLLAVILGASVTMSGTNFLGNMFGGGSGGNSGGDTESTYQKIINDIPAKEMFLVVLGILAFSTIAMIIALARFVVGSFVSLGLIQYNLNLIDGREVNVGQLFSKTSLLAKAIWLRLRMTIFVFLWSLLLIVPGVIKSFSYSMAGYILTENPEMSAKEAMEMSMRMMNGNKWRLFCLGISFIGWGILCVFTAGIGALWLNPYINAAFTSFYNEVSRGSF